MTFFGDKGCFTDLLSTRKFITSAELTPPRHYNLTSFMKAAEIISEYIDVIQINDHLLSTARISNIIAGQQCRLAGKEVLLQFTLRHKNRIAVQGDLLAMAASGLNNIIILGGYPCSTGKDTGATDVFDLNTVEAIEKVNNLTLKGELFNGEVISPPPYFNIGTIEFPCIRDDINARMDLLEKKIDAGARYIQLQAIFELQPVEKWMKEVVKRGLHKKARFFGAVLPFSGKERLNIISEIPHLDIPDHLIARFEKEPSETEAFYVTVDLVKGLRSIEGISGMHIRSIGAEDWVPKIIEATGLGGELVY